MCARPFTPRLGVASLILESLAASAPPFQLGAHKNIRLCAFGRSDGLHLTARAASASCAADDARTLTAERRCLVTAANNRECACPRAQGPATTSQGSARRRPAAEGAASYVGGPSSSHDARRRYGWRWGRRAFSSRPAGCSRCSCPADSSRGRGEAPSSSSSSCRPGRRRRCRRRHER